MMLRFAVFFLMACVPFCACVAAQSGQPDVSNFTTNFSVDPRFAGLTFTKQGSSIILRGRVESCKDKRDAMKQVAGIEGITEVEDHVEVKAKHVPDQTLVETINQSLKDHNFRAIRLHVSRGVVTLRGSVPSDSDSEHVVSLICGTAGVIDVDDRGLRVVGHAPVK